MLTQGDIRKGFSEFSRFTSYFGLSPVFARDFRSTDHSTIMPICTKEGLQKSSQPLENFNDNEEVFHCETTQEIFRNYDDYFRRIMLINSTVWACEYTGRSNLTYEEALSSEQQARKSVKYFSVPLRGPVLLAVKRAQQSTHSKLSNLLYQFFKDRYFPGEAVMATIKKNKLCQCKVVEIIAPKQNTLDEVCPAANIKYKIQQIENSDTNSIMVVSSSEIRRFKKKFLTRETLLYFLKESTEMSFSGYLVPKEDAYKKYVTELNVSFESLFVGKLPDWKPIKSRKNVTHETDQGSPNENGGLEKEKGKRKEKKQETLSKYLVKKNGELLQKEKEKQQEVERILQERLEKLQKEKEERQAEIERKRIERHEKIEEKWLKISKKCDDLEREDQKPFPRFEPVRTIFPNKYFGDLIHIKEFMQSHAQIMSANLFKDRMSFYEMCRAFTEREVAGPLSDIVQVLLNTIFSLQREEDDDCKAKYDIPRRENREEMLNAGLTHRFVQKHYSCRINELPVDPFSVSEVLRLHLLSSGATPDEKTEKWRFSYRNGYDGSEDPGLELIHRQPHIIRALQSHAIYQLPFSYIIKILNCLIHQILTYSGALNLIEERIEAFNEIQKKLRAIQVAENKRVATVTNEKKQLAGELSIQSFSELKVQDEKKKLEDEINKKVEKMIVNDEHQREKFVTELTDLEMNLFDHIVHLGSDRAYRNYYIFESLPGLFVEHLPESNDICLENPPKNDYRIAHCPHNKKEMKLLLLKMIAQEDKEKEKLKKTLIHNGEANKENQAFISNGELTKPNGSPTVLPGNGEIKYDNPQLPTAYDLYMCTGDPSHCIVHDDRNQDRVRWSFIHSEEGLDDLINSLNPYGIREGVLREHILRFKSLIGEHIKKCPTVFPCLSVSEDSKEEFRMKVLSETQKRYRNANFGSDTDNTLEVMHSLLVDDILDFEANITAGCLGKLKIKNLEQWRSDIRNNSYSAQCTKLVYGHHDQIYKDPGDGLANTVDIESEDSVDEEISLSSSPELLKSVRNLASALLQIEQAIDQKFLKSPFGITLDKNVPKDDERYEAGRKSIKLWEMSLMHSTNYSQIYLHKSVLSKAVKWYRSSLKARCIICNRGGDAQNLLLCDDCNAGSHLYCLEPKLTSIPEDDWFCRNCKAKRDEAEKSKEKKKRSPKKKVFKIDEDEECEEDENEIAEKTAHNPTRQEDAEIDEGNDQTCYTCFEEGSEITCSKCNYWFHLECVDMRRPPRGKWECSGCKMKDRKRKAVESDKDSISSDEILTRRSKRQRLVQSDAESEGSEPKRLKRMATAKQTTARRTGRTAAEDLPLNSAVLYELLNDIMKHEDAWPFIRPVSQHELPDYYHVIQKPMDFARVKSNLNMACYKTNEELMKDIELIFSNCDAYNQQGNDIYNAGASLEKFVVKRCGELNLPFTPSDMLTGATND